MRIPASMAMCLAACAAAAAEDLEINPGFAGARNGPNGSGIYAGRPCDFEIELHNRGDAQAKVVWSVNVLDEHGKPAFDREWQTDIPARTTLSRPLTVSPLQQPSPSCWYRATFRMKDSEGKVRAESIRDFRRDHDPWYRYSLPALDPPRRAEATPVGPAALIDEIECWMPPAAGPEAAQRGEGDPHPYFEGGRPAPHVKAVDWRAGLVPTHDAVEHAERWKEGFTRIDEVLGGKSRAARRGGYFAYRVGRGKLEAKRYLVAIEYPDDGDREWWVTVYDSPRPRLGGVFYTGKCLGAEDPRTFTTDFAAPNSGIYRWWYAFASRSPRGLAELSNDFGIWVVVADRDVFAPRSAGAAVRRIRLYELPERTAPAGEVPPEGVPRRHAFNAAEAGVEDDPDFWTAVHAACGLNALSPQWIPGGHYETDRARNAPTFRKPQYEAVLNSAARAGLAVWPAVEWGGSPVLPESAAARDPTGQPIRPAGRNAKQTAVCPDIADPNSLADLEKLFDDALGGALPRPAGLHVAWGHAGGWPQSFSYGTVRRFVEETKAKVPEEKMSEKELPGYVASQLREAFDRWWAEAERAFALKALAAARRRQPGIRLALSAAADGFPWTQEIYGNPSFADSKTWDQDFSKADLPAAGREGADPVSRLARMSPPVLLMSRDEGMLCLCPLRGLYPSRREAYLANFRGPDGFGCDRSFPFIQQPAWMPCAPAHAERAGAYLFAEEIAAMTASDPFVLAFSSRAPWTPGSLEEARAFLGAFTSLPAVAGTIILQKETDGGRAVVRSYSAGASLYLGVAHSGLTEAVLEAPVKDLGTHARDLVLHEDLTIAEGKLKLTVGPMTLRAVRLTTRR